MRKTAGADGEVTELLESKHTKNLLDFHLSPHVFLPG